MRPPPNRVETAAAESNQTAQPRSPEEDLVRATQVGHERGGPVALLMPGDRNTYERRRARSGGGSRRNTSQDITSGNSNVRRVRPRASGRRSSIDSSGRTRALFRDSASSKDASAIRSSRVRRPGARPPSATLGLQPGEIVEIKSKEEIFATLDDEDKTQGLRFDSEMLKYCGRRARVLRRIERIIDEKSGRMLRIRRDCVILDGVICTGDYHRSCPRAIYPYWREVWLKRVDPGTEPEGLGVAGASAFFGALTSACATPQDGEAATPTASSSHVSPRKCRYCSARSRSASRSGGSSTSS